jgi:N-acetylglucosamine-6-sulfatase
MMGGMSWDARGDVRSLRQTDGSYRQVGRAERFLSAATRGAAFAMLLASAAAAAAETPRPNFLFIFTDDHAPHAIGAYGSQINATPHLDRIAREGVTFVNSFCANSLCGPSRACILTGKHSHANGFMRNGNQFDGRQTTLPKLLQGAGYQTAVIGKWHLSSDPTGFDHWEILPGQGSYYNPDFLQSDGSRIRRPGYCTDVITDLSLEWLQRNREADRPFLLMCQHKAPHRNWSPALRHLDLYADQEIPLPATFYDDYAGRTKLLQQAEMSIRDHMMWGHDMKFRGENEFPEQFRQGANGEYQRMTAEQRAAWDAHYEPENQAVLARLRAGTITDDELLRWKYQRYIKDYLRCVAAVDEGVGRLLDYLDQSGLAENTVVIYASDQGFYLGDHGWYDKRWMFEESLKMPLLVRWPGRIQPGRRSEALVQNIDYAPTLLELAGVAVPAEMQGRSLAPLWEGEGSAPADWREAIYYAYYENAAEHQVPKHDGIRTLRHKLMYFPRTREWNLFDLERDPQELASVHADPAYAETLRAMQQRYRDLRQFYGVNSAAIPETRGDDPQWLRREQLLKQRAAAEQGPLTLAFVGDSITQGWEAAGKQAWDEFFAPLGAVNLGISGDRTEHVLWRLEQGGGLAGRRPQVVALLIGTNNTGHLQQDPAEVAIGVQRILETIAQQSPETRVVLHAIFPRGRTPEDPLRLQNEAINRRIRRLADGTRVRYLDLKEAFLEDDGTLPAEVMPDALHLSAEGYRRWAEALAPVLADWGLPLPQPAAIER